jgi:conjugative transfer signal peptidase TraF
MKRPTLFSAGLLGIILLGASNITLPRPFLTWNSTASVPIGLYGVQPVGDLHVGDMVLFSPPRTLTALLAERGYLPLGVPMLKPIAALPGDRVCRTEMQVTVNGSAIAYALERDRMGRPLPVWSGCRLLGPDELFLLNPAVAASFDGRYFGPLPVTAIVGRAVPLWTEGGQ